MFLNPDQQVFLLHMFSGSVTGTPTAQLYVNGVSTGSPVNGSGSGSDWLFTITLPGLDEDDWVEIICSGVVSTITQRSKILQGIVKEVIGLSAEAMWDYADRSLTDVDNINYKINIPVATIPVQRANTLSAYKGITWSFNMSGVGPESSGYYFTIKENEMMNDDEATLQINKDEVLILNSIVQSGNYNGFISYSSGDGGSLQLFIKPQVSSQVPSITKYYWDIKGIDSEVKLVSYGRLQVTEDITDKYQ